MAQPILCGVLHVPEREYDVVSDFVVDRWVAYKRTNAETPADPEIAERRGQAESQVLVSSTQACPRSKR